MDTIITQLTTDESRVLLQKIGQGFCGTVWADISQNRNIQESRYLVLKREDGGPGRSLLNEYQIHEQLLKTLQTDQHVCDMARFRVNLPFCEGVLARDSRTWPRILPRLPPQFEPCNALVNERIPPMSNRVCSLLFRTYHPEAIESSAADNENQYCLIRPYLGRRRHRPQATAIRTRPARLLVFSLRNFPLHMDQIEELGLPAMDYANAMADALAFLHWSAKVDANDVEFVLAPGRARETATKSNPGTGIGSIEFESEEFGSHTMWMLDFDCCREMPMDETGVKQAAKSFLRNDPFYPRPGGTNVSDVQLWHTFQSRFLEASCWILRESEESVQRLPGMLMEEIVRTCTGKAVMVMALD